MNAKQHDPLPTYKLPDHYIAQLLKMPVAKLRQYPDLLQAKRQLIITKRILKEARK